MASAGSNRALSACCRIGTLRADESVVIMCCNHLKMDQRNASVVLQNSRHDELTEAIFAKSDSDTDLRF